MIKSCIISPKMGSILQVTTAYNKEPKLEFAINGQTALPDFLEVAKLRNFLSNWLAENRREALDNET